jgi:hypothetical protein
MALGACVEPRGAAAQGLGGLGVLALQAFGLEGHEGVGVLRKTTRHRSGQTAVAGLLAQHRFGQLQIKRHRHRGPVAHRPPSLCALGGQSVGQRAQGQRLERTAGQQAAEQAARQHETKGSQQRHRRAM